MEYRRFGRTNWQVSSVGYGMWGMAGWKGSEVAESNKSLDLAVEKGCNFFDTAWGYGEGLSERILANLIKRHPGTRLYVATKIPPKNFKWPSKRGYRLEDCFPATHIIEYVEKSLSNLEVDTIDLIQFHVWEDDWSNNDEWKQALVQLRQQGKIDKVGVSVNRWEPENVLETLKTGAVDTVQVIYNIFDQAPEDKLFPLCKELDIGIIARVPFDEGTLTGNLSLNTKFPEGDWRNTYFVPENLKASVERAEALKALLPEGFTLAEVALKFILQNQDIGTVIPGMRKQRNVLANMQVGSNYYLPEELMEVLKQQRWDREPTEWSQ
ncbi:MAG: oxidoreductase [Cyclobacteriaceae bacterium]|nr:MAG: oxidoreductase [Cyclobacteriaceae bacterium]